MNGQTDRKDFCEILGELWASGTSLWLEGQMHVFKGKHLAQKVFAAPSGFSGGWQWNIQLVPLAVGIAKTTGKGVSQYTNEVPEEYFGRAGDHGL